MNKIDEVLAEMLPALGSKLESLLQRGDTNAGVVRTGLVRHDAINQLQGRSHTRKEATKKQCVLTQRNPNSHFHGPKAMLPTKVAAANTPPQLKPELLLLLQHNTRAVV